MAETLGKGFSSRLCFPSLNSHWRWLGVLKERGEGEIGTSNCKGQPSLSLPCAQSLSRVRLLVTPWTVARQAPLSVGFSGQEYWSGLPFPPPGDRLDPGIKPMFSALQADSLPAEPLGPLQMLHEPREGGRAQYNLELLIKCGQGPGKEDRLSKVWPDGKESQSLSHSYRLLLLLLSHFSMCPCMQTQTHIPRHSFTDSRTHFTSKAHSPRDSSKPTNSQASDSEPTDSPQACGESCVLNPESESSWLCPQRGGAIIPGPTWSLGPQGPWRAGGARRWAGPPETMPLKALGSRPGIYASWHVVRHPPPQLPGQLPPHTRAHQIGRLWRQLWRRRPRQQVRLLGTQRELREGVSTGQSPSMPSPSWGFH